MTLYEATELRVKLKRLETQIESGELSLFDRCTVEDDILDIKEQLGEFERQVNDPDTACDNCSG